MTRFSRRRRLIVNADDFGLSPSVNEAIIRAHREGILTTASLMVNEAASEEAVALAHANPRLGVGLHLTLLYGHSTLPPDRVPRLVNARGEFTTGLVRVDFRDPFRRKTRDQLRAEIHAQFRKFRQTGLPLDHVNGHHHLHLHPAVVRILRGDAAELGIKHVRLGVDPFWLNMRLASGSWGFRTGQAFRYHLLAAWARLRLRRCGIRHTRRVFGVLQTGRVDEAFVSRLLPVLPAGDAELYAHPSLDESRNELEALTSPRVREQVSKLGIRLIRYQDL